jgi:hypothetical protein
MNKLWPLGTWYLNRWEKKEPNSFIVDIGLVKNKANKEQQLHIGIV